MSRDPGETRGLTWEAGAAAGAPAAQHSRPTWRVSSAGTVSRSARAWARTGAAAWHGTARYGTAIASSRKSSKLVVLCASSEAATWLELSDTLGGGVGRRGGLARPPTRIQACSSRINDKEFEFVGPASAT